MSGDLEDFLRRAAERRQAKAAEQTRSESNVRRTPEYSDSRTERNASEQQEEILMAEIVDDDDDGTSIAVRMKRIEEAKRVAAGMEKEAAAKMRQVRGMLPRQAQAKKVFTGNTVQDLISTMQRPGGVQQMILMKEIFDRPVDRW
ncbi:hypothetical protein Poly51_51390 [Rubripirellula tenax]|uniref:Uncharacterized protein n=1 Tax=Rubripirellula tenax TaxID=2528015 RepID=A0A5C6EJA1_9BACT|nr:hypothetical protein [Rubripirellula tenax]TWU47339.1 hypothetical protein Poly51_51390 [Rubripirellula tenax]